MTWAAQLENGRDWGFSGDLGRVHQELAETLVQHVVTEDPQERGRVLRQLGGLLEFLGREAFQTFGPFACPGD